MMKQSRIVLGAVMALLPTVPASAANCLDDLNPDSGATAFLDCLKEMQRTIDQLQQDSSTTTTLSEGDVTRIAAELVSSHADELRGRDAEITDEHISELSNQLAVSHADALRGENGDDAEITEAVVAALAIELATRHAAALQGEPGNDAQIPNGSVLASTLPCGQLGDGWKPYYPAAGRFVVGAGAHSSDAMLRNRGENEKPLTEYSGTANLAEETLRSPAAANTGENPRVGGTEEHILVESEVPRRRHKVGWSSGEVLHTITFNRSKGPVENDEQMRLDFEREGGQAGRNFMTDWYGGGDAHNNMPPYIALYYCKKE